MCLFRKLLRNEAAIQRKLNHLNIVGLLGFVFEENVKELSGSYGLVLEFMQYGDLGNYIRKFQMRQQEKVRLICDVAQGMQYLHSQTPPIIHGDLKVENVLISDDLRAKVCIKCSAKIINLCY